MALKITVARKAPARVDLVAVGVTAAEPVAAPLGADRDVLRARGFEGKPGQAEIVSGTDGPVLVVGLGPADAVDAGVLRQASAAIARTARRSRSIAVDLLGDLPADLSPDTAVRAISEGLELGVYEYLALKSTAKAPELRAVTLVGTAGKKATDAIATGQKVAAAVNLARDLVNEPGGSLTPAAFADRARSEARAAGLRIQVMDLAAIRKAKLGGLLGVNRGSHHEPRFVRLTYTPAGKAKAHLALVGKGITFDSGGLSIKPAQGMMTMKCDMAGGAAVLAAMTAIAALAPKITVSAFVPLTDNMTGPDATRPGDVLTIRNGKTVEVLNTDAEGRLILADALSLATEAKPDAIVDLATLTGAAMAALGPRYAAVMGTDQGLVDQILAAGGRTGERVWQLPLPSEYRSMLDSPVADVKNIGGPLGGALTAGLFLKEFVGEGIAWAHLDIAGPAFTETPFDEHPKGGTGYGVRLLVDLVERFESPS